MHWSVDLSLVAHQHVSMGVCHGPKEHHGVDCQPRRPDLFSPAISFQPSSRSLPYLTLLLLCRPDDDSAAHGLVVSFVGVVAAARRPGRTDIINNDEDSMAKSSQKNKNGCRCARGDRWALFGLASAWSRPSRGGGRVARMNNALRVALSRGHDHSGG